MKGIIVQARLASKRFPRKVLAPLGGQPVLKHVLERATQIGPQVVLAVPYGDDELGEIAEQMTIPVVYGPASDVLKRFSKAANCYHIETIMRLTADCPLLDINLCRKVLELYHDCDYAAIGWPGTFPKGYGCEVFSKAALDLADKNANSDYDREHVTPWIVWHMKCKYLKQDKDESHLNYCVDYPEDIARLEPILTSA